jgi:hypothetical protein
MEKTPTRKGPKSPRLNSDPLKKVANYVVHLTDLEFTGRLIITLDFYQGGIRCASQSIEQSLSVSTTCVEPIPD